MFELLKFKTAITPSDSVRSVTRGWGNIASRETNYQEVPFSKHLQTIKEVDSVCGQRKASEKVPGINYPWLSSTQLLLLYQVNLSNVAAHDFALTAFHSPSSEYNNITFVNRNKVG